MSQPQSQPQKTPGLMLLGRICPTPRQGARFPNSSPVSTGLRLPRGISTWTPRSQHVPLCSLQFSEESCGGQRLDLGGLDRELIMQFLKVFTVSIHCEGPGEKSLNIFQLYLDTESIFSPQYFSYWFSVKHSMRNAAYILLSLANFKGLRRPKVKIV